MLPRRRENLTKQRGQNQLPGPQFLIRTAVHPPRNIPPNWSLFQLPATTQPPAPVDIAAIVSEAVLGGLQAAGILPQAQKETDGSNATPAAAVQGSVAAVIQDITGERPSPTNPSTISTSLLSINSIAQSNDRPQLIHQQIAVALASRVSDKIQ